MAFKEFGTPIKEYRQVEAVADKVPGLWSVAPISPVSLENSVKEQRGV